MFFFLAVLSDIILFLVFIIFFSASSSEQRLKLEENEKQNRTEGHVPEEKYEEYIGLKEAEF